MLLLRVTTSALQACVLLNKEINMEVDVNLITGLMLGAEYADFRDEGGDQFVVVDILFVRLLFIW